MHSFDDKNGKSWKIDLTVGIMEQAKDQLDIDLFDPVNEDRQLIAELAPIGPDSIRLFSKLLHLLCVEQGEAEIMAPGEFNTLLDAKAFNNAYTAFYQEWEAFFQQLGRKDLAKVINKMNQMIQEGVAKVEEKISKLNYEKAREQVSNSATS